MSRLNQRTQKPKKFKAKETKEVDPSTPNITQVSLTKYITKWTHQCNQQINRAQKLTVRNEKRTLVKTHQISNITNQKIYKKE